MLTPATTCAVELQCQDREGRGAKVTIRLPFSTDIDTAIAVQNLFASRIAAISDAVIPSGAVRYVQTDTSPDAAGVDSNVGYYLCLYYSNGVDTEPFFIPSPNRTFLEASGSFAGIRLDLANPTVVSLADALTTALATIVGPDNEPWGRVLVAGGASR